MPTMYFPMWQIRDLIQTGVVTTNYEILLERHYRRWVKKGDTVVDVGAHTGRHVKELADCVGTEGRIFAFEPVPQLCDQLSKKFSSEVVRVFQVALCNAQGHADFFFADGSPQQSGLRERDYMEKEKVNPQKLSVKTNRLDAFVDELPSLSYIKIDVEGAEIEVLRGALKVLERYRPVVSVEYGVGSYSAYGCDAYSLYDLSESQGYALYDIFLNPLRDRQVWGMAIDSIYYDFLMIPLEKETEFLNIVRPDNYLMMAARLLREDLPLDKIEQVACVPAGFDATRYLALHPDVRASGLAAEQHYLQYGFAEKRKY